jgi:hypothetical protein
MNSLSSNMKAVCANIWPNMEAIDHVNNIDYNSKQI